MIARVEEKGNNTNDYYEAGVNIIPSLPLGGINPDTCGVDCLKDKLTMETMTGKWRGWQVCIILMFYQDVIKGPVFINAHFIKSLVSR